MLTLALLVQKYLLTGTKVQILTPEEHFIVRNPVGPMFAIQLFLVVVASKYSDAKTVQASIDNAATCIYEVCVCVCVSVVAVEAVVGMYICMVCTYVYIKFSRR